MPHYKIIRFYRNDLPSEVVRTGLTLEEAQAHCRDRETSSSTCVHPLNVARTFALGPWFDGYDDE